MSYTFISQFTKLLELEPFKLVVGKSSSSIDKIIVNSINVTCQLLLTYLIVYSLINGRNFLHFQFSCLCLQSILNSQALTSIIYFELNTWFYSILSIPFLIFVHYLSFFSYLCLAFLILIYHLYLFQFFELIAFPRMISIELWRARISCYRSCKRTHDFPQLSFKLVDFVAPVSSSI